MAYHYLMPFAAILFAASFLGERITAPQIAGGIAVLTGVYLVQLKYNRTDGGETRRRSEINT